MAKAEYEEVPAKVTPYQFCHSRAMHLYHHGMPLQLLAEYMGHASVISTWIYAYEETEMERVAIEKCHGRNVAATDLPEWKNNDELIKNCMALR